MTLDVYQKDLYMIIGIYYLVLRAAVSILTRVFFPSTPNRRKESEDCNSCYTLDIAFPPPPTKEMNKDA